MPTVHLLIKGKVQGVAYRASAQDKAIQLSLTGWVRNTPQGHVEATVTGPAPPLQQIITWCKQGTPAAPVPNVEVHPPPHNPPPRFSPTLSFLRLIRFTTTFIIISFFSGLLSAIISVSATSALSAIFLLPSCRYKTPFFSRNHTNRNAAILLLPSEKE